MYNINIVLVFIAIFLALYCAIMRCDPEPFQGIITNTKTLLNNHKRTARLKIENMKSRIVSNIKRKFR